MTNVPPAPAPPPRKRGWVKWLIFGCLGVVLIGALIVGGIFWGVSKATAGPENAVREFLAAAAAADYPAAHNYFSTSLKQQQPYDQFVSEAETPPRYSDITGTTFSNRSVDQNGAELQGTVSLKNGEKIPAAFRLIRQNDQWKIDAYRIGS